MAVQNSNEINVRINGVLVRNVTQCSMSISNNVIPVTTQPTGAFIEYISGIRDASLSISGYLDTVELNRYTLGSPIQVIFGTRVQGHQTVSGFISSISYDGGIDSAPNFSIDIQISGDVENFVPNVEDRTICFGSDGLCFGSDSLTGPEINYIQ